VLERERRGGADNKWPGDLCAQKSASRSRQLVWVAHLPPQLGLQFGRVGAQEIAQFGPSNGRFHAAGRELIIGADNLAQ